MPQGSVRNRALRACSLFDYIGIEGEVGVGKPDPQAYLLALSALGAQPSMTWMIGDNVEWDVAAPQRLGMQAVRRTESPGMQTMPFAVSASWSRLCEPRRFAIPAAAAWHPSHSVSWTHGLSQMLAHRCRH